MHPHLTVADLMHLSLIYVCDTTMLLLLEDLGTLVHVAAMQPNCFAWCHEQLLQSDASEPQIATADVSLACQRKFLLFNESTSMLTAG